MDSTIKGSKHNFSHKELKQLINPEIMKTVFQEKLPFFSNGSLIITKCEVLHTRYSFDLNKHSQKNRYFSVRYRLKVTDKGQKRHGTQMLYAKAYLEGLSQEGFDSVKLGTLFKPEFGEALVYLADLHMIIWAFPNDPFLSHLPELIGSSKIRNLLPYELLSPEIEKPSDIRTVKVDVISYHPEDRCTIRCSLEWGSGDSVSSTVVYGKMFTDERGRGLYRLSKYLWMMSLDNPDSFMVAQPLKYHAPLKVVWHRALAGKPVNAIIKRSNCKELLESAAKGLASLHRSDTSKIVMISSRDPFSVIQKKINVLIQEFPTLKISLESVLVQLKRDFSNLSSILDRPSHGSFRIKELLICKNRLGVFDFDNVYMGDPLRDLALFLTDLHIHFRDSALLNFMANTFYNSYRSQVDWEVSADRLNWHIKVQFMKRAYWIYKNKRFDPRLESKIQRVVALAQKGIDFDLLAQKAHGE